jgi:hypothetical protein
MFNGIGALVRTAQGLRLIGAQIKRLPVRLLTTQTFETGDMRLIVPAGDPPVAGTKDALTLFRIGLNGFDGFSKRFHIDTVGNGL